MNSALKWKLIAGFLLVFVAGGTTGVFLATAHARRLFMHSDQTGFVATRMKDRMRTELNLTPDQVAKISPIIEKTATQLQQIRMETGRRVHQAIIESHEQIGANLSEEQKHKLKLMEMRHRRWHGPRQHGPGLSPGERLEPDWRHDR